MEALLSQPILKELKLKQNNLTSFQFLALILCFSILSCADQEITDFERIEIPLMGDIFSIDILNDSLIVAAGGDIWQNGFIAQSEDDGNNWEFIEISNKALLCMDLSRANGVLGGIDGHFFTFENDVWNFHRTTEWGYIKDIGRLNDSTTIAVGGHAFRLGFVNKINENQKATNIYSRDIEFNAIHIINEQNILVAGYGAILHSPDRGDSWTITNGSGDFFKDLYFIDENTGFAIGYNGLILKTINGGLSWQESKGLGDLSGVDGLRSMDQLENGDLWIVGKDGLILISSDLGSSWQKSNLNVNEDLFFVKEFNNHVFISGENGLLVKIIL